MVGTTARQVFRSPLDLDNFSPDTEDISIFLDGKFMLLEAAAGGNRVFAASLTDLSEITSTENDFALLPQSQGENSGVYSGDGNGGWEKILELADLNSSNLIYCHANNNSSSQIVAVPHIPLPQDLSNTALVLIPDTNNVQGEVTLDLGTGPFPVRTLSSPILPADALVASEEYRIRFAGTEYRLERFQTEDTALAQASAVQAGSFANSAQSFAEQAEQAAQDSDTSNIPVIANGNSADIGSSVQLTTALGGFRYIKSINLPNSTDLDTVTAAGFYDGIELVNGPFDFVGWLYVEVQRWSQFDTYCVQTVTFLQFGDRPTKWSRRQVNDVWQDWEPIRNSGFYTPEDFGAIGNGVADDTVAVERAVQAGAAVMSGQYAITRPIINDGQSVSISGTAGATIINQHAGDALNFSLDTPSQYQRTSDNVIVNNLIISGAQNVGGGIGLAIFVAPGGSGSVAKTFDIRNVSVEGFDDAHGFADGFNFFDARNSSLVDCRAQGARDLARAGNGVSFNGSSDPVDSVVRGFHSYFHTAGIGVLGTYEGLVIGDPVIIGCTYGVFAALDENPVIGDNEGKQLLSITGGHINSDFAGIFMDRVRVYKINDVDLLCTTPNSSWTGIRADLDGSATGYGYIGQCTIKDETTGAVSTGQTTGIRLEGHTSGITSTIIEGNQYSLLRTGISLDTDVRQVKYDQNESFFVGCVTNVQNLGVGNTAT